MQIMWMCILILINAYGLRHACFAPCKAELRTPLHQHYFEVTPQIRGWTFFYFEVLFAQHLQNQFRESLQIPETLQVFSSPWHKLCV